MVKRILVEVYTLLEGVCCLIPGFIGYNFRRILYKIWLGGQGIGFSIGRFARIQQPQAVYIGENVGINDGAWIAANSNVGQIFVGDNTLIGPNCVIHSGNHVFKERDVLIRQQGHTFKPITIGKDVWIAANVTILRGVTVGDGAVVAAGSVVTANVEELAIVAGVPAKKIGER